MATPLIILALTTEHILTIAGIALSLLIVALAVAHKFGVLTKSVSRVEEDIKEIKQDMKALPELAGKVQTILSSKLFIIESPKRLNKVGKKALKDSAIEKIIEPLLPEITKKVIESKPTNAYIAEKNIINEINKLKDRGDLINNIQEGAFNAGFDVDIILLVTAIHYRDKIFESLEWDIDQIDEHISAQ